MPSILTLTMNPALDLLTTPYVFSADEAADMARAGADLVVCHAAPVASAFPPDRPAPRLLHNPPSHPPPSTRSH